MVYFFHKMFHPFQALRQMVAPAYLGVDIGTTSLKVVELARGRELPRLVNYALLESQGSLARANTAFQTSSLKLFEDEITELLRATIGRMKPRTTEVFASLPIFSVFMTVLTLPEMSAGDLQKNIAYQAKQYIPIPISEVAIDWLKVGEMTDEKGFRFDQVLLISVPREQIKKYQKIFERAGLSLRALEIESLSLARAVTGNDPTPTVIVDVGSRSTTVAVVEGGVLKFAAQSDFAGASLTQAISSSLSINPLRAEELKRERGIVGTGPNYELSTIMTSIVDAIIGEVKRALGGYEAQFPAAKKLERALLSGGGANLLGIEKYMSDQFGIPTAKAMPLLKIEYPLMLESLAGELNPLLSVALGAALREFS